MSQALITALKAACRKSLDRYQWLAPEALSKDDVWAVRLGAFVWDLAAPLQLEKSQVRNQLLKLEKAGLVMRERRKARPSAAHQWWPVGFLDELRAERHPATVAASRSTRCMRVPVPAR